MFEIIVALLKVLVPFSVLSFIQNMAFTASSRSRNSGDPSYHRWCAYMSNGVYYITNALLTVYIIKYGALWQLAVQGVAYTLATAEGSVLMMKKMLAKEKGKRQVGAGQSNATFTQSEAEILRKRALIVDTGDGLGTFTTEEIAQIKDALLADRIKRQQALEAITIPDATGFSGCGSQPLTLMPTELSSQPYRPSWQPKDISAVPPAIPGQGAKL